MRETQIAQLQNLRLRDKRFNQQTASDLQQVACQFGEFAAFAFFERHVGEEWLPDHAVNEIAQTIRQRIQIRMIDLLNIASEFIQAAEKRAGLEIDVFIALSGHNMATNDATLKTSAGRSSTRPTLIFYSERDHCEDS